jgi:hypothetical protein
MTCKMRPLTALILFLLIGPGTALSQSPPFQFLQKPGPYPVGLKVVNQHVRHESFPPHHIVPKHVRGKEAVLCKLSSCIQRCRAGSSQ